MTSTGADDEGAEAAGFQGQEPCPSPDPQAVAELVRREAVLAALPLPPCMERLLSLFSIVIKVGPGWVGGFCLEGSGVWWMSLGRQP